MTGYQEVNIVRMRPVIIFSSECRSLFYTNQSDTYSNTLSTLPSHITSHHVTSQLN